MGKLFKRLSIALIVVLLLLAGGVWWLLSYIAPEEQLDMSYTPISMKEKTLAVIKSMKPELILTESDINSLIKMNLNRDLAEHIRLVGSRFELRGDHLSAYMNVRYRDRIPFQLNAEYQMEWREPNLVLWPQSLKIKNIDLPIFMLEKITVPLDLSGDGMIALDKIQFEPERIRVKFKLNL